MKFIIMFLLLLLPIFADDYEHHSKKHIQKELSHIKLSHKQKKEIKKILKQFRHDLKEYGKLKREIEKKKKTIFLQKELNVQELNNLNKILNQKAHTIENSFLQKTHLLLNEKQRKRFIKYFDDWEVQ
ncbi:hypothetical protein [Sulfurimonas sp.]